MKAKAVFLFMLMMVSCGKKEINFSKQVFDDTGIILKKYTVLEDNNTSAVGDYSENFYVKVDNLDFINILTQIEHPNTKKTEWKKVAYGYKFELYNTANNEHKLYELNINDKTLNYLFIED